MNYREFGNTGLQVSEIGFGAWAIGGNSHGNSYGTTDDRTSLAAIRKALDLGCNFFDTADVYGFGHSEQLLAKGLRGLRDRVIIATKVGADFYRGAGLQNFAPDYLAFALQASLERLQTDYIDIYQLHNPSLRLIEHPETYQALQEFKREGKIRAWGISIFDPTEGLTAITVGQPDCLQVAYNIFNPKPAGQLFTKALEVGCAIIAREPLANGFLSGKYDEDAQFEAGDIRHHWRREYVRARVRAAQALKVLFKDRNETLCQLALRYVLANPAVSLTIPGIKSPEQAEEDLLSSDLLPLNPTELASIQELAARQFDLS